VLGDHSRFERGREQDACVPKLTDYVPSSIDVYIAFKQTQASVV